MRKGIYYNAVYFLLQKNVNKVASLTSIIKKSKWATMGRSSYCEIYDV